MFYSKIIKKFIFVILLINISIFELFAIVFERRKSFNDDIFEYYFLLAPIERPGTGSFLSLGAFINNIEVPWIDEGRFNFIGGFGKGRGENEFEGEDMDAYGLSIIDFPVLLMILHLVQLD